MGEAVLTSTHNVCFEQKYEKYQNFYLKPSVFGGEIFSIIVFSYKTARERSEDALDP